MHITTEDNFLEVETTHPWSNQFSVLRYADSSTSSIPHGFFRNWLDEDISNQNFGKFFIGRGSGCGVGSIVKYDSEYQSLRFGRFIAGGLRLKFLLNGQHESDSISICMFSVFGNGFKNLPPPQYGDTILKNDIWIGDEALFLGGSTVENGCVIGARAVVPPNFKSEPYGVYVGSPARLVKFRFSEKICELLLELSWWDMPMDWIKSNNDYFLVKLSAIEEENAIELLKNLIQKKKLYLEQTVSRNS